MIGIVNKYYAKTAGVTAALALALGSYTNHKLDQVGPQLDNRTFMEARETHESASKLEHTVFEQMKKRDYGLAPYTSGFGASTKRTMDVVDAMHAKAYTLVPQKTYEPQNEQFESDMNRTGLSLVGTMGLGLMSIVYTIRALGRKPKKPLEIEPEKTSTCKTKAVDLEIME